MSLSNMASMLDEFKADCETRDMSHSSMLSYLSAVRLFMIFMDLIELLVAFIQAYVFTLLSALYFGLATIEPEHH